MKYKVIIDNCGDITMDGSRMFTINRPRQYLELGIPIGKKLIVSSKELRKSNKLKLTSTAILPLYTMAGLSSYLEFCAPSLLNLFHEIPTILYWKAL